MSFPRYPEYKDSGVDWLGLVPMHWKVVQLKRFLDIQNGADHKPIEVEEGHPVYGSGGVFAFASDYIHDGESILLGRKGTIDKPLYVCGRFWTVDTMYWSKINPKAVGKFLYYACTTIPFNYYSTNTALPSMTKGDLSAHLIGAPPTEEQGSIANFLDHETAKIDALIAEQEKLIELLKEKRQAVISHAVTKGLNPNVKMKDSGVEWLGQVPEHWAVAPIGYFAQVDSGATPNRETPAFWGGDIPWVKTGEINYNEIVETDECITEQGLLGSSARIAPPGTLLMAMYGQGVTRGRVAILGIDAAYNQACAAMQFSDSLDVRFCFYFFISAYEFFRDNGNETSQMNLSTGVIRKFKLTIPPMSEQRKIIKKLDAEVLKVDSLLLEAKHAIALLQERRSALISAAVTGQIDVRNFVPEAELA